MIRPTARSWRSALLACVVVVSVCACAPEPAEEDGASLSAEGSAKADALLADHQAAVAAGNWEAAEAAAAQLADGYRDSAQRRAIMPGLAEVEAKAGQVREARRLRDRWEYQAVSLPSGVQRSATIGSRTVAFEEGEVEPVADARLVLRDHPDWGRSAYLLLEQQRFDCGKPCAMQIAFDDAAATAWPGKQADSGQGPALFINEERRFVRALEEASTVRITLPKGSGSIPSLGFEVAGFEPGRYAKP